MVSLTQSTAVQLIRITLYPAPTGKYPAPTFWVSTQRPRRPTPPPRRSVVRKRLPPAPAKSAKRQAQQTSAKNSAPSGQESASTTWWSRPGVGRAPRACGGGGRRRRGRPSLAAMADRRHVAVNVHYCPAVECLSPAPRARANNRCIKFRNALPHKGNVHMFTMRFSFLTVTLTFLS